MRPKGCNRRAPMRAKCAFIEHQCEVFDNFLTGWRLVACPVFASKFFKDFSNGCTRERTLNADQNQYQDIDFVINHSLMSHGRRCLSVRNRRYNSASTVDFRTKTSAPATPTTTPNTIMHTTVKTQLPASSGYIFKGCSARAFIAGMAIDYLLRLEKNLERH